MKKTRSPSRPACIMQSAIKRTGLTVRSLCERAVIPVSTYGDHLRNGGLTQAEIRRMDKIVHFTDEELIGLIRG